MDPVLGKMPVAQLKLCNRGYMHSVSMDGAELFCKTESSSEDWVVILKNFTLNTTNDKF
jgi:hypothetical protein